VAGVRRALPKDLYKGGLAVSGIYDLRPIVQVDWLNADLQLDERARCASPAFLPTATRAPVMTCVGGDESSEFKRQNALLGERWRGAFAGDIAMPGAITSRSSTASPSSRARSSRARAS
jgi:arylformamidase